MHPQEQHDQKALKKISVLQLILGAWILVGVLLQTGVFNLITHWTLGSLLVATGILGVIATVEWKNNIVAPERLRTLAALNTALGLVGIIIASACAVLIVLIQSDLCFSQCAEYIGAPESEMRSAVKTVLSTSMLINGPTAGLVAATALLAGCVARRNAVSMFSRPPGYTQSEGVVIPVQGPCPAYEETTEKA